MNTHFHIMSLLGMITSLSGDSGDTFIGDGFLFDFYLAVIFLLRIIFLIFILATYVGLIYLIHYLFSLPLRRTERARLFLNLMEDAIKHGESVEKMILSVAESRDPVVGLRVNLLAAHIENDQKFVEALEKVPRLLPPQVTAMIRAGEKLGDLPKILPACREILRDRTSAVSSAVHYLILVTFVFSPVFISVTLLTNVFVVPKIKDVFNGMGIKFSSDAAFVFGHTGLLIGIEAVVTLLLLVITFAYIGGSQFVKLFQIKEFPIVDWIAWRIPWKQKRLLRTFSAMLAVLLDSQMPETEAVRLAGEATANEICRRRAQRVITALEQGVKLAEAIRSFDEAGEFHWRLTNAIYARGKFLDALHGWHEALDAKAFQQQEATAHIVTSGLVILNGVFVALIATAMFGMLVLVLKGMIGQT